ncbi:geobacillin-26 family protein [Brevibacillus brevis]|uniref:geobacillin-26 family protein n=1 Tax=Brevibacillus brevis TaxID=1393 RepID=UPI000D10C0ED|nr:geobacillin-26 family protein [Brevibacillus brevis]PSJ66057.1 hypothetical protein C7J99_27195 [Brevibacillus brevis]RED22243.1 hypothetical protein DES34_1174 [Brevibacillus brevis]GEC91084.1 hypothetical protein BBR01nite_34150 [Brevibacillus brevis]VEF86347.1 Uncharacterised protein [Brevibacillus brevis]
MLDLRKNFIKIASTAVISTFAFTAMLAPITAAKEANLEYVKTMNEELQKLDEFANENVQIEYIKEDANVRETKVTTDNEEVITRLYKDTNVLEIETNGEITSIDVENYDQKKKSAQALAIDPDDENSVESYEGSYEIYYDYYDNQNFWALQWEGETKNTFENNNNEDDLSDFAESIDSLANLEEDLDTAISFGVPGVGFSAVIAAICVNPPLALSVGILAGIAATYALTTVCLNIMTDMMPHQKKAARAFYAIDPEGPETLL